jgi:hypothetical protein
MEIGNCSKCGTNNLVTDNTCRVCGSDISGVFDKRTSIFGRIRKALTAGTIKHQQKLELKRIFRTVLADKQVTDDELSTIDRVYRESELSKKEFDKVREEIFIEYLDQYFRRRRITKPEKELVYESARQLGFSGSILNNIRTNFRFFELLHALETYPLEDLPAARDSRVILRKGEIDYFTAKGSLIEERVIKRELVGRSHGISIPTPIKGVRYRVGQSRGRMVSERGMVPISYGEFTVTNRRLVFTGDKKSANSEFSKLQDYELFTDAIRYSMTTRQTPITVLFDDPRCAEVAGHYIRRLLEAGI